MAIAEKNLTMKKNVCPVPSHKIVSHQAVLDHVYDTISKCQKPSGTDLQSPLCTTYRCSGKVGEPTSHNSLQSLHNCMSMPSLKPALQTQPVACVYSLWHCALLAWLMYVQTCLAVDVGAAMTVGLRIDLRGNQGPFACCPLH